MLSKAVVERLFRAAQRFNKTDIMKSLPKSMFSSTRDDDILQEENFNIANSYAVELIHPTR